MLKFFISHGQGHMFKIYDTIGNALSLGTHMPNIKAPSLSKKVIANDKVNI